jgi:hypothetical protein
MRNVIRIIGLLALVAFISVVPDRTAQGQAVQPGGQAARPAAQPVPVGHSDLPFDKHDLTGFWNASNEGKPLRVLNTLSMDRPPMTPQGQAMLKTVKTGYNGRELGNGVVQDMKQWNDPIMWCDPPGFPRVIWHPTGPGMKIVQTPNETIQFFENNHTWRDMWTDGRKLADDPEPRWYGYSVGQWVGDVFVVNSSGFDPRSWVDQYGSPHSDQMKIEERYERIDHDRLALTMTLTDPKIYTKPWVSYRMILKLAAKSERTPVDNWSKKADGTPYGDFREDICLYSESQSFFSNIDPEDTGGLKPPSRKK